MHREMAEHATDYARVTALDAELTGLIAQRLVAEHEWLELSDD